MIWSGRERRNKKIPLPPPHLLDDPLLFNPSLLLEYSMALDKQAALIVVGGVAALAGV